jgi:hypothetical protein
MGAGGLAMSSMELPLGPAQKAREPRASARALPGSRSTATRFDPADLRERLRKILPVVPTFAEELEIARLQATRLRAQNRRILEEVRPLQQHGRTGAREKRHHPWPRSLPLPSRGRYQIRISDRASRG